MKNWIKVLGTAAIGGASTAVAGAYSSGADLSHMGGAALAGAASALVALFIHPPRKEDVADVARIGALALLVCLGLSTTADAQVAFRAAQCSTTTADVTVTTTTEAIAITSPVVVLPYDSAEVYIFGWAQLTTGTNTTAVTPQIRRGASTSGTAVAEANAETVKAAAGSTEPFYALAVEQRTASSVQYSLTLKQTGASADGSILQASICVLTK